MKVYIEKEKKNISVKFSGKVSLLLNKLKINPEAVLISRNNILITKDTKLNDTDEIKILSVVSGG